MYSFNNISKEKAGLTDDQIYLATGEKTIVEETQSHYNELTKIVKIIDNNEIYLSSQNPACMVYTLRNEIIDELPDGTLKYEKILVRGQLLDLGINEILYLAKKDITKPEDVINKYIEKGIVHKMLVLPDKYPITKGSDNNVKEYLAYISKAIEEIIKARIAGKKILVQCLDGDLFAPLIIICFMIYKLVEGVKKTPSKVPNTRGLSFVDFTHRYIYAKRKTIFTSDTEFYNLLVEWEKFIRNT